MWNSEVTLVGRKSIDHVCLARMRACALLRDVALYARMCACCARSSCVVPCSAVAFYFFLRACASAGARKRACARACARAIDACPTKLVSELYLSLEKLAQQVAPYGARAHDIWIIWLSLLPLS